MKVQYICECCRNTFPTEEKAKECEASHQKPISFFEWGYRMPNKKLPSYIIVNMDDHSVVQYVYHRQII